MTILTQSYARLSALQRELNNLNAIYKRKSDELMADLQATRTLISQSASGLDVEKIALAETVLYTTAYSKGGEDRASARQDAIDQLALHGGGQLWDEFYGTKAYAHWYGQRSDHRYGLGPKHGSVVFQIGLTQAARQRVPQELTAQEIEAAVYYLTNLERIQAAAEQVAA